MSLNDSLFGEESLRWKEYEALLKAWKDKKRVTHKMVKYNINTTNK